MQADAYGPKTSVVSYEIGLRAVPFTLRKVSLPDLSALGQQVVGGAEEIRTPDLRRAKAALSQLSYGPFSAAHAAFVQSTSWPSWSPAKPGQWWAMVDSNHRPRSYQDRALTS